MMQALLPFESVEEMFERVFRRLKPRTDPPQFQVRFYPYANLDSTIRLDRGHSRVRVRMSDQLEAAPFHVHEALAWVLLAKLYKKPIPDEHNRAYRDFVQQDEVRLRAREVRRARGRKQMRPPGGSRHDLSVMFDELNQRFFGGALPKPAIGWSPRASKRLLGHWDSVHEAIVVSRALDREDTPRYVVEYVLYHEMLHVKHPAVYRAERRCVHTPEFKREERLFPRYEEANQFLRTL